MKMLSIYEDDIAVHNGNYGCDSDCDSDSDHSCDGCDYSCQGVA